MRPTFLGFETQKRTIQVAQKHLDIAGNNISNINTVGYTRQRVDVYSMYVSGNQSLRWSSSTNNLSLTGQGVNAYGVSQLRDQYIDKRYRENTGIEAETEKTTNVLADIEDVLDNIDTDGLQHYTEQYFKALQDYSVERPDAAEVATIATNSAVNLCRLLNDYSTKLNETEQTYVSELEDTVSYVNNLLSEMNKLNDRIARELINYPDGYGPNELYDQLNNYIDELANYGDISISQNSNGTFSVKMAGVQVVDGENFKINTLVLGDYKENGQAFLDFESGEEVNLHSGILRSYINMLNGNGVYATGRQNGSYGIAYFKSAIDEFARTLANTFNSANGADEDPTRQMFVGYPAGGNDPTRDENGDGVMDGTYSEVVITAGNIHVSTIWKENPTMIGMSKKTDENTGKSIYGYDEVTGEDGKVNLQNKNVLYLLSKFEDGNLRFGNENDFRGDMYQYISFLSDRLAETISYETSRYETAKTTVNTLLDARDEVSGVQMDEEGINMLNYQKWYNASSRMLTTMDDALDKLINGTGRVGL